MRLQNDTENSEKQKLELSVDSRAIQQALINLIDNAIKHSPKNAEIAVSLFIVLILVLVLVLGPI